MFLFTLCIALLLPVLFPFYHPLYFAPFIVLALPRSPLHRTLWRALTSGFIVDLFSAETLLGYYALNYCLATLLLYRYRTLFFEDQFTTIPLMSLIFAITTSLLQVATFAVVGRPFVLSWEWAYIELFLTPLQTALYAVIFYSIPQLLFIFARRHLRLFKLRSYS